ncbi:MAG: winged helix-turn-helix domain-containing protein [Acidobacteriota bacterium]|nr:winged helix-turn-helix domain-containing protein [Acidobacteriota bacterium]
MAFQVSTNEIIYCFDDVTVDSENFRAQKNGRNITLTPRAFDVLIFLIKNAGRAVEKQEIFEAVWKDTFVTDNALTKIIKEIRHAIDDDAAHPRYIETVPKRGYHFICEIERKPKQVTPEIEITPNEEIILEKDDEPIENVLQPSHQKNPQHFGFSKTVLALSLAGLISISLLAIWLMIRQEPAEAPSSTIRSLAVLPFKPLNSDSRDESLELGMAETLITRLSNLRQVTVRPISAVRKYTDLQQDPVKAGKEMKVETVLDGSIQKAGERLRITVRLVNVNSGESLWSEQFDENFTDIFNVQDSIAERVTNALALRLSRYEKEQLAKHLTDNTDAYQLYLRGQLIWHGRRQKWIEQSLAFYEQALEKDPNFALAHIGIADGYMMLGGHQKIPMEEAESKARPSIMKALEIDNSLAQAHNALAELKYQFEYDWSGAEKEFKKAIELNPNVAWIHQAYGWFLMCTGRFDEAKFEMEKARELDPSSLTINVGRGRLYYFSRQYDQALQHFENILAVEPNEGSSHYSLDAIYTQKQMYEKVVETFMKSITAHGAPPETVEEFRRAFNESGWQGFLHKRLELFEKRIKKGQQVDPYTLAQTYVRLGQKDEAFKWLEKVVETRQPSAIMLKIEPAYDVLRDDPRFDQLVRKIGLQP